MCREICYNRDVFRFYLPILNMSKQLLNEVFRQRKVMRYQQKTAQVEDTLAILDDFGYHIIKLSYT